MCLDEHVDGAYQALASVCSKQSTVETCMIWRMMHKWEDFRMVNCVVHANLSPLFSGPQACPVSRNKEHINI